MGRVPESAAKDRFRFDGESKMPRGDGANHEDDRLPVSICDSPRKRRSCQRNNSIYDVAVKSQSNDRLLQQEVR